MVNGYCPEPIVSLQLASSIKKTCITKEKGMNCWVCILIELKTQMQNSPFLIDEDNEK
jgi:hypothetical protein